MTVHSYPHKVCVRGLFAASLALTGCPGGGDDTTGATDPATSDATTTATGVTTSDATVDGTTTGTTGDGTTADTTGDGTTGTTTEDLPTTGAPETTEGTETTTGDVDADMDGVPARMDCDDADPLNFPGNPEVCDDQDNDCDDLIDDDAIDAMTYYEDQDQDGHGGDDSAFQACTQPNTAVTTGGDCNDADATVFPDADGVCAAGATCKAIFDALAPEQDGLYLIDRDGAGPGMPLEVWCDMTNGGRTAALIINTVNEGVSLADFGAGDVATELLAIDPALASDAGASAVQAWLDLNAFDYTELWLAAHADGVETYASAAIAGDDLRIDFGEDGYLLWDPDGYSWCGGDASFTDDGEGQVDKPPGAPDGCKGHINLGSGFDFSESGFDPNLGLTASGPDGAHFMHAEFGQTTVYYPMAGVAYVLWAR
jgi:hypothetical protein